MDTERMNEALDEAQAAFWAVFAARFPECTSGDLPMMDQIAFDEACRTVAAVWVGCNRP